MEHSGEPLPCEVRLLLVGAIAAALISIALRLKNLNLPESPQRVYWTGAHVTFIARVLIDLRF